MRKRLEELEARVAQLEEIVDFLLEGLDEVTDEIFDEAMEE